MDKFERGKRAEFACDDKWLMGDDGCEMVSLPQELMSNNIIPQELLDKFNSLGCTSFVLTSEQIKELMEHDDMRILKKMSRGDW